MSPLARSLLALAVVALLSAAFAGPVSDARAMLHCDQIHDGTYGNITNRVESNHVDQSDIVFDVPPSKCPPIGSRQVGTTVMACDMFGPPPKIQWLVVGKRVRVTCQWRAGQTCPQGLDINIDQHCKIIEKPVTDKPIIY